MWCYTNKRRYNSRVGEGDVSQEGWTNPEKRLADNNIARVVSQVKESLRAIPQEITPSEEKLIFDSQELLASGKDLFSEPQDAQELPQTLWSSGEGDAVDSASGSAAGGDDEEGDIVEI